MDVQEPGRYISIRVYTSTPGASFCLGMKVFIIDFWLRMYIRLQFVPHPSMSKAHYIKPTIHLRAVLTVCACMWVIL